MLQKTRDLVMKVYGELKSKHGFSCGLKEENLDQYVMMEFDSKENCIVYDPKRIQENYELGKRVGEYKGYTYETLIMFALLHELGHYYDYQSNPNAFNYTNKQEYIQMERNGISLAKKLVPPGYERMFHDFNESIISSYERDLSD